MSGQALDSAGQAFAQDRAKSQLWQCLRFDALIQKPEPGSFKNSISSGVDARPSTSLRCG